MYSLKFFWVLLYNIVIRKKEAMALYGPCYSILELLYFILIFFLLSIFFNLIFFLDDKEVCDHTIMN